MVECTCSFKFILSKTFNIKIVKNIYNCRLKRTKIRAYIVRKICNNIWKAPQTVGFN